MVFLSALTRWCIGVLPYRATIDTKSNVSSTASVSSFAILSAPGAFPHGAVARVLIPTDMTEPWVG